VGISGGRPDELHLLFINSRRSFSFFRYCTPKSVSFLKPCFLNLDKKPAYNNAWLARKSDKAQAARADHSDVCNHPTNWLAGHISNDKTIA